MKKFLLFLLLACPLLGNAQIGEHRNDFSIGVNSGYVLGNIGFSPKVTQTMHGGLTAGLSMRYVCEKYFNTICSVYAEVNYTQAGWKEDIVDAEDQPVLHGGNGAAETYSRTLNYLQIPVFAHLAWGKERRGLQFFAQAGPQFGLLLSESTDTNFTPEDMNLDDRANKTTAQYGMEVEHRFDYGIAAGLGMELSVPQVGHFLLEGRYYYGLGNIYGDSKRDYFGKSNLGNIVIKAAYLFDLGKSKHP